MLQRNIQDTFNAAVGGFITVWFEGHEEEQAPTAMQVAIAEAKRAQDRQKSPKESSRDRRKHAKSRAELDNAKRPFSFRSDPVNLAFGGIKAWGDVAAVAVRPQDQLPIRVVCLALPSLTQSFCCSLLHCMQEERGYTRWDDASKAKAPAVLHAAPDAGRRVADDDETHENQTTDTVYKLPSEELCTQCKLVHPTKPKENIMGKMVFDGLCDYCSGRMLPPKRKASRMPGIPSAGRKKPEDTGENPWALPAHEAEQFRSVSALSGAKNSLQNIVPNGRRSGSVSPTQMSSDMVSASLPGAVAAKPRLGHLAGAGRPPPRSTAQGGPKDKLSRTMANWGDGPQVGIERGFPANWPSAYPDIGLPFTSAALVSKAAVISKLTDPQLYTGTHRHRFDKDGKGRGILGRDYVAKGDGSVQGRRGAHEALCLRQVRTPNASRRRVPTIHTSRESRWASLTDTSDDATHLITQ